jgi:hypothetical protein
MPLWLDQPHTVDAYSLTTGTDGGGGVSYTYVLVQSAVGCRIDPQGGGQRSVFDQEQEVQNCRLSFLASDFTTEPARGWKYVATDTGRTFVVLGLEKGRAANPGFTMIPAFIYVNVEEWF